MKKNYLGIIIITALLIFSGFYGYSLFRATVNGDESIIAEHAYWFSRDGMVKSPMFNALGIGWENREYHYHKLFVVAGAAVFKLFGLSLYGLRTISYLFFLLIIYLIIRYIRQSSHLFGRDAILISILLFLGNATFFEYGTIYRPETMVMALGFLCFYFLHSGLLNHKVSYFYMAAVSAGLSAFTHLNGLTFIFSGFILLVFNKRYLHSIGFGFVGTAVALFYFFDITTMPEIKAFWYQFTNDPNLTKEDFRFYTPILKILNEQLRFFWNADIASFSLLLILSFVFFFKSIWHNQRNLLIYFAALVIGLASLTHGKTLKYGLLYFPFITLIITYSIVNMKLLGNIQRKTFIGAIALFFAVNTFSIVKRTIEFRNTIALTEQMAQYLPQKNTNVLVCEFFYFNGTKDFTIHLPLAFELKYEKYVKRTPVAKDFFDFAEMQNDKYIILDKSANNTSLLVMLGFDNLREGQTFYNYSVIKKNSEFAIFELKK